MKKQEPKVEDVKAEAKPAGFISLGIKARLMIPQLFPERSNLITQVLAKDIAEKVLFTQDEIKLFNLQALPNGTTKWENKNEKPKDVVFTEMELKFLRDQIERVDKEGGFNSDLAEVALRIQKL